MNIELVEKIKKAVLDMTSKVVMSKNHIYTRVSDEAWLQGVSTISSIVPKDWLSAWGAKEAVKFLGYSDYPEDTELASQKLSEIGILYQDLGKEINCIELNQGNLSEEDIEKEISLCRKKYIEKYQAILKEAKGASGRKSKTALVDGKAGHEWLEDYCKAKIRGTELPKIPEGTLERPIQQFLEWADKEVDYWILSEARVAYPEKGFAGTLDALAMMKSSKLALLDFKFASFISEEYHLQTAGYQHTFDKYDIKIDQRIIIRLPKTLEKEEWDKVNFKYFKVPNNIEIRVVETSYELDRDAFLAALIVKKWVNAVKKPY